MTVNYFQQANQQLKAGELKQAIASYQKAIEKNPNFAWYYQNLADALVQDRQIERAIANYEKAIALKTDSAWSYYKLGKLLLERKQTEQAIQHLQRAIDIQDDVADFYVVLGHALSENSLLEEAEKVYQKARQIDSEIITPDKNLSDLSMEKIDTISSDSKTKYSLDKTEEAIKLIAFYLPQYHPIPENDEWWGKGFTEWTNVTQAKPLFEGHYQPRLPADLGFYDLRLPEIREDQAKLAKQNGIYGFCYYYYWFDGKRLLERPLEDMLNSKKPDFPFCLCWANENWTRRWDGLEKEILIAQKYSNNSYKEFANSLIPYLKDSRYIHIEDRPLILIYRVGNLPNPMKAINIWREFFRKHGIGEVHISGVLGFGLKNPVELGCDSAVQFPPNSVAAVRLSTSELPLNNFSGVIYDYKQTAINTLKENFPNYQFFPGVMTSWDNTARRKQNAGIWLNSEPENYELWLRGTIEKVLKCPNSNEKIIFINAWNEWAEGAYLEPDQKYGYEYLEATQKALFGLHSLENRVSLLRYIRINHPEELEDHLLNLVTKIVDEDPDINLLKTLLIRQEVVLVNSIEILKLEDIIWQLESPTPLIEINSRLLSLKIQGWILLTESDEPLIIKLTLGNRIIKEIPVNLYRQDVAEAYPDIQRKVNHFQQIIDLKQLPFLENQLNLTLHLKFSKRPEEKLLGKIVIHRRALIEELKNKFLNLTEVSYKILEDLEKVVNSNDIF
jgi:tetratricopeptide (TPR) repeat protein